MQQFTSKTPLARYRKDARHRGSMCRAMATLPEDEPVTDEARERAGKFAAVAESSQRSVDTITARAADVQRADDILTDAKALESVTRFRTKEAYEQARLDLTAAASDIVRTILPIAPSLIAKGGIKRVIGLIEDGVAKLSTPDAPESVRTEHAPVIERHLARMREADLAEDRAGAALSALRASIVLFKAAQQREREIAYGRLIELVGRADAEAYFLAARTRSSSVEDDAEDEGEDEDES
jgi:hypothetical protein